MYHTYSISPPMPRQGEVTFTLYSRLTDTSKSNGVSFGDKIKVVLMCKAREMGDARHPEGIEAEKEKRNEKATDLFARSSHDHRHLRGNQAT